MWATHVLTKLQENGSLIDSLQATVNFLNENKLLQRAQAIQVQIYS